MLDRADQSVYEITLQGRIQDFWNEGSNLQRGIRFAILFYLIFLRITRAKVKPSGSALTALARNALGMKCSVTICPTENNGPAIFHVSG